MSICPACTPWCATTENQLAIRLRNMELAPEIKPHECPHCGGVEWTTTDKFVVRESAPRDCRLQARELASVDRENRQRKIIAQAIWSYQQAEESFGSIDVTPEPASMHALIRMTTMDQAELIRSELAKRGELCR